MPASAGISVLPPAPRTEVGLTLWLQPSEVTQDGAEGRPLGWLIGQALAGKHGQLQTRGFRQLVLLLVEVLFLWGREPEGVSDPSPSLSQVSQEAESNPQSSRAGLARSLFCHPHFTDEATEPWQKEADLPATKKPGLEPKSSKLLCGASHTWPFLSWLPPPLFPGSLADAAS